MNPLLRYRVTDFQSYHLNPQPSLSLGEDIQRER